MIHEPYNDKECLGPISQMMAEMVANHDPILVEMLHRFPTMEDHIAHLRSTPQRDDLGDPHDGPRVEACTPSQRLRIADNDAPNCVERAAVFAAVEALRRPELMFQLGTVMTKYGPHTIPLINGEAVLLHPKITKECVECGLALASPGPIAIEPRNAIAWTLDMGASEAPELRNGSSTAYIAQNAIRRLIDKGSVPEAKEVDAIGILLALAERAARRLGTRALTLVRITARAIADLLDIVLSQRNLSFDVGGYHFDTPKWFDEGATAVGKVGLDLGSLYLRSKLGAIGIAPEIIGLLESHLGEEGRTLGPLAHPPELATFAKFAAPRTG